jgi:ubiquitin-conjugating enzyme E2 O
MQARAWSKAIRREWSLLRGGLPEDGSLLVRCYEERTDLARACIRGASETPYHRHLFVFDLQFGGRYPLEPPGVTYWAHGLRCNPNLYANGKVCLSLLGTWSGRDGEHGETWRPNESSALQALLSIQALVLNEKPYFNEAGWGGQMGSEEGERNSRLYNEQVRLVCLRSSLALLRAPPLHFEAVVEEHYRREGGAILAECEAELAEEGPTRPSEGYKASLSKLMPRLREALGPGPVDVNGLD